MITYAMPEFWLGMLLLIGFAVLLSWFPIGGISDPSATGGGFGKLVDEAHHLVLPCVTLAVAYLGEYHIVMRSSLVDTMKEDYLTLARAKGLAESVVRRRHAVPNALLPVVTLIAINFGFVLSGCDRSRDDLLLARPRPRDLQRDPGPGPADAAGPLPGLQRVGHLLQPARRPGLPPFNLTGRNVGAVRRHIEATLRGRVKDADQADITPAAIADLSRWVIANRWLPTLPELVDQVLAVEPSFQDSR